MKVRYRYRAYPNGDQTKALARTFGCARRVYNDAISTRDDAYSRGILLRDSEIQTRVITEAKRTAERSWLADVSSVPLIQSVNDAHQAYRNWFDSIKGKRKGSTVGRPRFKTRKARQQSIRFTRKGFKVTTRGVLLAKIGNIRIEWSRSLPAVPSSVTVVREADGRYYVSFVVERIETPLPRSSVVAGVDLGLIDLAAIVSSDGNRRKIPNPRCLRRRERSLRRAQKAMSRKQKGSCNRERARVDVAKKHRKIRDSRLDHHHKLALQLIRDSQAIAVEDLAVAAMARSLHAKSVRDAGWGLLLELLKQKAARFGRSISTASRWAPTSQTCACCGHNDGRKPLDVRSWRCRSCGALLDRDFNAAVNIIDAAGLAESLNACGGEVRLRLAGALASEAGTAEQPPVR